LTIEHRAIVTPISEISKILGVPRHEIYDLVDGGKIATACIPGVNGKPVLMADVVDVCEIMLSRESGSYQFKEVRISLDLVRPRTGCVRGKIAKETIGELCDLRQDYPERVRPLALRPLDGGFHEIVDGEASFLAAVELGAPNVRAYLLGIDGATAARLALRLHAPFGRKLSNSEKCSWVHCALDRAPALAAAIMSGELTLRPAGRALGVNKDTIRKVRAERANKCAALIADAQAPKTARVDGLTPALTETERIAALDAIRALAVTITLETASREAVRRDVARLADTCLDFLSRELGCQRRGVRSRLPELMEVTEEAAAEQQASAANREAEVCRFALNSGYTVQEAEHVLRERDLHSSRMAQIGATGGCFSPSWFGGDQQDIPEAVRLTTACLKRVP
jgi:hypothetical protein